MQWSFVARAVSAGVLWRVVALRQIIVVATTRGVVVALGLVVKVATTVRVVGPAVVTCADEPNGRAAVRSAQIRQARVYSQDRASHVALWVKGRVVATWVTGVVASA